MTSPLRLRLDTAALIANWQWLAAQSGAAACGAAIKADGYGLGAKQIVSRLASVGCRDFFVATWDEAEALGALPEAATLSVLHGVRAEDMAVALASPARPVLNSVEQVQRWKSVGSLPCDVMIDTGMNRLGLAVEDVAAGLLTGLTIETLMSHLACADENHAMNASQLAAFAALKGKTSAKRMSLANSAGICLGTDYAFDLTRPGLALYGGVPRAEAEGHIAQVAFPEAQVVQRRQVNAGESIGYGATFVAPHDMAVAILNLGYADGYLRGFSGTGSAGDSRFPLLGRVSMDLIAVGVDAAPDVVEGDWVSLDFSLAAAAAQSGLAPYELLTGLGRRYAREWT